MSGVRSRLRHLPPAMLASGVLLVLAVPVGALLAGVAGAVGSAAGVCLVVVSYVISGLSVAWADAVNPRLVLPLGLLTYALKFTVLGFVMAALARTGWAGLVPMGVTVIVAVVVWTGTHLWWTLRAPNPYDGLVKQR
jgi:hypothetical protein